MHSQGDGIVADSEWWFSYESGEAWCEAAYAKYSVSPFIAEFANTASTLPIILLPLLNAAMVSAYIQEVNPLALLPHLLLAFNGLASSYYHATLNLFGQLVDEVSILWLLVSCVIAFLPTFRCWPYKYRNQINVLRWGFILLAVTISALCFVQPSMNAFALMLFTIPGLSLIYIEGYRGELPEAERLASKVFKLWTAATVFWLSDKLACDIWLRLGTPYLHALFHLFSSVAGYNVFLMLSLLDIERRRKRGEHRLRVEIRQFPSGSKDWLLSFTYLRVWHDGEEFDDGCRRKEALQQELSCSAIRKRILLAPSVTSGRTQIHQMNTKPPTSLPTPPTSEESRSGSDEDEKLVVDALGKLCHQRHQFLRAQQRCYFN